MTLRTDTMKLWGLFADGELSEVKQSSKKPQRLDFSVGGYNYHDEYEVRRLKVEIVPDDFAD